MPVKVKSFQPLAENEKLCCPWCNAPVKDPLVEPGPTAGTVSLGFIACCSKMKDYVCSLVERTGPAVPLIGG